MGTYTIYAPLSGQAIALNCYCYRRTYVPCNTTACPSSTAYPYCKDKTICVTCGKPCFCEKCCYHIVVGEGSGYRSPLDISAAAGTWINAYMSASIASVKIIHMSGVCLSATGDINLGTYLEAWTGLNATGKRLGRLLYAHLSNRQHANGQIFNRGCCEYPWVISIGQVPTVPTGQDCYKSTHVHMSIWADTGVTASRSNSYGCGQNIYAGTSAIYWWTY